MAEGFAGCERGRLMGDPIWEPLMGGRIGRELCVGYGFCYVWDVMDSKLRLPSSRVASVFFFNTPPLAPSVRKLSIAYLCMALITPPPSLPPPHRRQCPPPPSLSRTSSSLHGKTGGQQSPRLPSPRRSPPSRRDASQSLHSTIHPPCSLPSRTLTGPSRAIHQVCSSLHRAHTRPLMRPTKSRRHRRMNGTPSMTRNRTVCLLSSHLFPRARSTLRLHPLRTSCQKTPSRPTRTCSTGSAVTRTVPHASSRRRLVR